MKNEIKAIFNSILCICAEGVEFMTRTELASAIIKEASKGYKICKEEGIIMDKLKEMVLERAKEGKIVFMTVDGPMEADLDKFIEQPAEGILYDLNRDRLTVLAFIDNPGWVNDFAVGLVITRLKEKLAGM